jgi:hypothetical protein
VVIAFSGQMLMRIAPPPPVAGWHREAFRPDGEDPAVSCCTALEYPTLRIATRHQLGVGRLEGSMSLLLGQTG